MTCGERIRKLRKDKQLSVKQLAVEAGVSEEQLRGWEDSTSLPDAGKLLVLAAILGTTAEDLQNGRKRPKKHSSETYRKLGSGLFATALILYFIGTGTGEFDRQMLLFGMSLVNYGTSATAVCLLIGAAFCLAAGIFCKIHSIKLRSKE